MFGFPLAFTAPAVLFGLIALPAIWWLLRMTPPRPQMEIFPPLRILAQVRRKEETPSKSPWWLTLLRLTLAGLVILALAGPVFNPRESTITENGPLVLLIDNGWATAPDWADRVTVAERLIMDAEASEVPVSLLFTADASHDATPSSAEDAIERLNAASPVPLKPDRPRAIAALAAAMEGIAPGTLAILSDGIAVDGDEEEALAALAKLGTTQMLLFEEDRAETLALIDAANATDAFEVSATRLSADSAAAYALTARDVRGRAIAKGEVSFQAGETMVSGRIAAPFELRNDFARITVDGTATAGTTFLLDDSFRRRRVGLLSGTPADQVQPLLAPLYYIERALQPYADLLRPETAELAEAIPQLLERRPSVIVMADIGTLPEDSYAPLTDWIEAGGTLLRFAGPRLAGAANDDPLVPVTLRQGERALGGALSWTKPQNLASYPAESPFAGMVPSDDIIVRRQVLAEPSADLAENTWASLEDGTPLITTQEIGEGRIVLFHITAEATWSNLPISGTFVEMLRRTVALSQVSTPTGNEDVGANVQASTGPQNLPPYRMLDASGALVEPSGSARPLAVSGTAAPVASHENPPGLYGTEDGFTALNLMQPEDRLVPLAFPSNLTPIRAAYGTDGTLSLKPGLLGAAMLLLLLDTLIVITLSGAFARLWRRRHGARPATTSLLILTLAVPLLWGEPVGAADERPGDAELLAQLDTTHIGYVLTGESDVDEISERGLAGLSQFLTYRTSLEPGSPTGIDLQTDELAFFPLIYWPISATAPMPTEEAISRIDAYMKNGGTVLFDTRDQFSSISDASTPETQRLRAILADLDIPPLEPVPEDHVLTKAFYLLPEFPGRYRGGELWIEQLANDETRALASADGVSSVIITSNDLAGAWAIDENGVPLFPTVPADPAQREYAYRTGVNIMMYMLTGNYKTDQVHVPALLERLGQ